jgi:hypothetical protein
MDLRDIRRPNRNIFICNSNAEAGRIAGFKDPVQEVKCTTGLSVCRLQRWPSSCFHQ